MFLEEAVGNWSYMGSCKGSLKGEVWKERGDGFEENHSDLKKKKMQRRKEEKKEEFERSQREGFERERKKSKRKS